MIRVEIEASEAPGWYNWQWAFPEGGIAFSGKSRTPLLDACRALKRAGADPEDEIGLFRKGRSDFDIKTRVGIGARLTVQEKADGGAPYFAKWKAYEEPSHS